MGGRIGSSPTLHDAMAGRADVQPSPLDIRRAMPDLLKDWDVIEISEAETRAYATVGVSLDDRRYIISSGLDRVAEELAKRGVEPIEIQYDQVSDWGGCVSCSTHAISREPC